MKGRKGETDRNEGLEGTWGREGGFGVTLRVTGAGDGEEAPRSGGRGGKGSMWAWEKGGVGFGVTLKDKQRAEKGKQPGVRG